MTEFLLRVFIPGYRQTGQPDRSAVGRLSGWVGIVCNALLCAGKLAVGAAAGSVSITADALNNLSDAASSIVTLAGFKLAETPPDEDHPYGHARFEYLSGLAVAAMILLIGAELAKSSLDKILHPAAVEFSGVMAAVLVGSICVKLWLSLFNRRLGDRIQSQTLLATAADSRNDVVTTTAVLAAALIEHFSGVQVDGWMGMAVAVFILWSGIHMARDTISPLLGENADPALRQAIVDTVTQEPKVLGYHDLMVHDYGPGQRFASVHVEMDHREDPLVCHELIDDIERACMRRHNVHLVIHYDPIVTDDGELEALRCRVREILAQVDSRLSIHDFRMVRGTRRTNLIFDVALPDDLRSRKKDLLALLDRELNREGETVYRCVVTFDPASFNPS